MLCLLSLTAARTHRLADVAAYGARVGLGALTASRKTLGVAGTAVRADILETLDVAGDLALEIAFGFEGLDDAADFVLLLRRQILDLQKRIDLGLLADELGARKADAVYRRQAVRNALIIGECDARNSHNSV